jgi:uncharacterized protein YfaA (DUF2138 family)
VAKLYRFELDEPQEVKRTETLRKLLSHPFFAYITERYDFNEVHLVVENPDLERLIYEKNLPRIENLLTGKPL